MTGWTLSDAQVADFCRDGYLMIPEYFPPADMALLLDVARADRELASGARDLLDSEGKASRLSLRYDLPDDTYGALVRSRGIVEPMEQLLGTEVYHYHHKMMLKEPRVGGAWEWHQDYGYWYASFLRADMASCMIAVDRASRENGCLQVLKGSHRLGRLDHGRTGEQTGADPERVELARQRLELVHCEMEPGTALFFHCNLLHRSDPNLSPQPRWALICCYSASDNTPLQPDVPGQYAPLERWDDDRVRRAAQRHWEEVGP